MQRRNGILAFITAMALVAWIVAGSYLFSTNCCDDTTVPLAAAGNLIIEDGPDFRIQATSAILFVKNEASPVILDEVSKPLMEAIQYLKSNPLKKLTISGLYLGDETKGIALGESRADSIRQLFLRSGTPSYQLKIQSNRRDDLTQNPENNTIVGAVDFTFTCLAPFEANDIETKFSIKANNNLMFKHSSTGLLMETTKEMQQVLSKIAAYLQTQSNRKLVLTGYSHPKELNETALENLGWARANMLRGLLMELGANGRQIEIYGIADDRLAVIDSELYGKFLPNAMGFKFESFTTQYNKNLDKEIRRIEADLKEMQVFRFKDFGKDEHKILKDKKSKEYLNDLILYISVNQKAKIFCVGHSNQLASEDESHESASSRATFTKDYLVRHGIPSERIVLKSAGANHPLGEETTQYGQQINRRVDLFISYDGKTPKLYALPPRNLGEIPKEKKKSPPKSSQSKKKPQKDSSNVSEKQPVVEKEKKDSL